jgi:hypothetical protein
MELNQALGWLEDDVAVDARIKVLVDYVELVLGGGEGLTYSENDRSDLRASMLRDLAAHWIAGRRGEADALADRPPSPEERRRGFYAVP